MPRRRTTKKERAISVAQAERDWYEKHGGSEAGYVARYGEPGVTAEWYGNGGRAIHKADHDALVRAEREAGITR